MSASVTLAAVVLAGVGACYSGPINMAPRIDDISPVDPLKRGSNIGFLVKASDPDNDPLTVAWSRSRDNCSGPSFDPRTLTTDMTYTVPGSDTGAAFCVRATVTDRWGATALLERLVKPGNLPPAIQLLVEGEDIRSGGWRAQEPFSLFRLIRFDASNTTDPDDEDLDFEWALETLDGSLMPCPDSTVSEERSICARPTEPGPLTVRLTVSDPFGEEMTATRTVVVAEDDFPCLAQTMPTFAETLISSGPDEEQFFQVLSVVDDGEPFPPPAGTPEKTIFRWFLGRGDGALEPQEVTRAYFTVPGGRFFFGDKVRVRVEIADRNLIRSNLDLGRCQDDDICATGPACRQRMTWRIHYDQ